MSEQDSIKIQNSSISGSFAPIPSDGAENDAAEFSYQGLRTRVAYHVNEAITSGKLLVQEKVQPVPGSGGSMMLYGPVQFSHWYAHLPEVSQQHYNCDYCRQIWAHLSTLAILDDDGFLEYPVAKAFAEYVGTSIDPVMDRLFANYPEVTQAIQNTAKRKATLMPVAQLSDMLAARVVGGWEHFFGVLEKQVLHDWNKDHGPVNDLMYVQGLFKSFISTEINLPLLSKLFSYIKKEIGEKDHTALGRADELVKAIGDVRRVQNLSGNGLVYLWTLLHKKENSWLLHVNGSVLGIVLDTAIELKDKDNMEAALAQVKRLLTTATAGENYKQKTAEASEASLDQAFKFLEEKGQKGALDRRLLPFHEVKSVIWHEAVEATAEAAQPQAMTAADAAFQQLKEKKNPDLAANKKMDEILGDVVVDKAVSAAEFIRSLGEYSELSISRRTMKLMPVFATDSVGDYDPTELLSFDTEIGDHVAMLSPPTPMIYGHVARWAGAVDEVLGIHMLSRETYKDMPVRAVFRTKQHNPGECDHVLQVENLAMNFQKELPQFGSCVLGTMIKSEHFGMSRALCELSKQIPLHVEAGKDATGGVFLTPGLAINAVCKDGTRARISITSMK